MKNCEICNKKFVPANIKKPARTCSKQCKNELARKNTLSQFSNTTARDAHRKISLEQKNNAEYQRKSRESIDARTVRWKIEGHPRVGMLQPDSAKAAIGNANRGRFKGKTWDEIYGKEVADRRRLENSISMSKKNEVLLKEKRSSLEEMILPLLPSYKNNIQVGYYNVDFIDETAKHIIEINGDYWHCNPKIYADDWVHPYFKITAKQRREDEAERTQYLKSLGYTVTIVWESDLQDFMKTL